MSISLLFATFAVLGCNSRPSAPAFEDGPVYRDAREGFRFFVPEGWKQRGRGNVPPGKIQGERMIVEYKCMTCVQAGSLMVTVADVPEGVPLSEYLIKHSLTGEKWKLSGPAEDFAVNDAPAARIVFSMREGKETMVREVVAFRRGERVYFFKGFYAKSDTPSQQAIRAAVDTVVW